MIDMIVINYRLTRPFSFFVPFDLKGILAVFGIQLVSINRGVLKELNKFDSFLFESCQERGLGSSIDTHGHHATREYILAAVLR